MCRIESETPPTAPPLVHVTPEKPTDDIAKLSARRKHLGFIWATVIVGAILLTCTVIVVAVGLDIQHKEKKENKTQDDPVVQALMQLKDKLTIISREEWKSASTNGDIPELSEVKYVIMCHTAGRSCTTEEKCSSVIRWIQNYFISSKKYKDIVYNFILGGDGNIYEGLGWNKQNNIISNSISIGIIGNYIYDSLTEDMINKTKMFLNESVESGKLDKNYYLIPHNQTKNTQSPGSNVFREIKSWPHYSSNHIVS